MNSAELNYFREQKHYSLQEIEKKLNLSEKENLKDILGTLKKFGIVKTVSNSEEHEYEELSDPEIIADSCESGTCKYKFCFTGIAVLGSHVFCCYPKYIDNNDSPKEHLKLCLNAIRKYNSSAEQLVRLYNWNGEGQTFNRLAISLYILNDYYENGIYSAQKEIIETNGSGEIYWDRTINETFALLRNNRPYYFDLQTINTQENEQDFIKQLHKCIITECSEYLEHNQLLYFFGISHANISSQKLIDFGSTEYIKYRLEKAIAGEFITKKQNLLKTLYAYVAELENNKTHDSISLYGTNSFNLVWEEALRSTVDNCLDRPVLGGNTPRSLIEKVKWEKTSGGECYSKESLEPDIICIEDGKFIILDAKYYNVEWGRNTSGQLEIRHQPGVQDIVKQFAYQKAFGEHIKDGFSQTANVFLVPQKGTGNESVGKVKSMGYAQMETLQKNDDFHLSPIQILEINAGYVFENYLQGRQCQEILAEIQYQEIKKDAVFSYRNKNIYSSFDSYFGFYAAEKTKEEYSCDTRNKTLIGYLRQDYFRKIKGRNSFLFYFYFLKDSKRYLYSCELNSCGKFIGITGMDNASATEFIYGEIKAGSLRLVTRARLAQMLNETNPNPDISFSETDLNADQYFVFEINQTSPWKEYTQSEIAKKISENPNNDGLHKYAPKVIKENP